MQPVEVVDFEHQLDAHAVASGYPLPGEAGSLASRGQVGGAPESDAHAVADDTRVGSVVAFEGGSRGRRYRT